MNHCACITSYKIYRHVWLMELFHVFVGDQQTVPILPVTGKIHAALSP